jgi:signal transduction histidine kinase
MAASSTENHKDLLTVPWTNIVRFIRQLGHDLRNNLNAAQLQSAYIVELSEDAELKKEINRLREMISEMAANLQRVTTGLGQINPTFMSYRAADFIEDLKQKIATDFGGQDLKVTWEVQLGDASLNIDPQLLQQAFMELFTNAFQHERGEGALAVRAYADDGRFVLALREPKARFELSTEKWGYEPLRNISPRHYGLGLNRVRIILEAHGGQLRAHYDPNTSVLTTTVTLPLLRE